MAVLAISFRIGDIADHQARYKSLTERIVEIADGYTSEETTSFYLIKSSLSVSELQSDLYLKTKFSNEYDLLIVIDLSSRDYSIKGKFQYDALLKGLLDQR